jgi:hypothetical protein
MPPADLWRAYKRRKTGGKYRETWAKENPLQESPGRAVEILLDGPPLRQDAERDKRPAALGVVNDAGYAVSVGGQLVAIRTSENVLAPVSGLCRLKSCGQLYGNAPGPCPADLRVLLKCNRCGLSRADHIAGAGDI